MDPRVEWAVVIIKADLDQQLSLTQIALSVNLSPSRLSHLFRSEIGVSLTEYIKSLRMQKAKELLETTFLTNQQIMTRIGIKDESHFWRDFKRACGMTPAEYRARYLAEKSLSSEARKAGEQNQPIFSRNGP